MLKEISTIPDRISRLFGAQAEFIEWDEYARRVDFINEFGRIQNEL